MHWRRILAGTHFTILPLQSYRYTFLQKLAVQMLYTYEIHALLAMTHYSDFYQQTSPCMPGISLQHFQQYSPQLLTMGYIPLPSNPTSSPHPLPQQYLCFAAH